MAVFSFVELYPFIACVPAKNLDIVGTRKYDRKLLIRERHRCMDINRFAAMGHVSIRVHHILQNF